MRGPGHHRPHPLAGQWGHHPRLAHLSSSHKGLRPPGLRPLIPPPTHLPTGMLSHPPIPIADMAEHTERLKANDSLKLSQEYEVNWGRYRASPDLVPQHPDPPYLSLPFPVVHRPRAAVHLGTFKPGGQQTEEPLR